MTDTAGPPDTPDLAHRVLKELHAIRKTRRGMTSTSLASSPVIASLLGDGDPVLAFSTLRTLALGSDLDVAMLAALSSLGLTSEGRTHLNRLDDFGSDMGYEQRQVRRYSDSGLQQLAQLIASHWPASTLPHLELTAIRTGPNSVDCRVTTTRRRHIEMRPVQVTVRRDSTEDYITLDQLDEAGAVSGDLIRTHHSQALVLDFPPATSLSLVWKGELWPRHQATLVGDFADCAATFTMLGAKLMLMLEPLRTPTLEP